VLLSSYPESHTFSLTGHSFSGARSCSRTTLDLTTSGQGTGRILRETENLQETTCYESTATPTKKSAEERAHLSSDPPATRRTRTWDHKKTLQTHSTSREKTMVIATANVTCSQQVGSLLFHPGTTQCGRSNHWKTTANVTKTLAFSSRKGECNNISKKLWHKSPRSMVRSKTPLGFGPLLLTKLLESIQRQAAISINWCLSLLSR